MEDLLSIVARQSIATCMRLSVIMNVYPLVIKSYFTMYTCSDTHRYVALNGRFHNDNGPAIETLSGTDRIWYQHGQVQSVNDQPSRITTNEFELAIEWHHQGHPHRENGPAVLIFDHHNVVAFWRHQGNLHRDNGPAVIWFNSSMDEIIHADHYTNGNLGESIGWPECRRFEESHGDTMEEIRHWHKYITRVDQSIEKS